MQIVPEILEKVERAGARVVAVTKYFDAETTQQLLSLLQKSPAFWALGENRAEVLREKKLPRASVHFIGRIQSRKIPDIAAHCSVVHSLENISHAEKFAAQKNPPSVFLQVNISREPQKGGVSPEEFPEFLREVRSLGLEVLGLSAMGAGAVSVAEKEQEFQQLVSLRNTGIPEGKISAGTSRDFELALKNGIEVVRIGQALLPKI